MMTKQKWTSRARVGKKRHKLKDTSDRYEHYMKEAARNKSIT